MRHSPGAAGIVLRRPGPDVRNPALRGQSEHGSVGNYLAGYTWYDAAGNVIKQQGEGQRSFAKTVFDGLGRATKQYVGYDWTKRPTAKRTTSRRHDPRTDRDHVRRGRQRAAGHLASAAARRHGHRRTDHDVGQPAAGARHVRGLLVR